MKKLLTIVILGLFAHAQAEVLVGIQARNNVTAYATVDISQDPSTHVYTYTYTVTNDASSQQSVDNFAFDIDESTPVLEASAPTGWSYGRYTHKNIFEFSSTEGITEENRISLPGGGYEIRSPYDIQPGASLCCFVIKTFSQPAQGNAYLQGYVPLPQTTGAEEYEPDFTTLGLGSGNLEDNSFIVSVDVPKIPLYDGNRRPAIDGFVAPININSANKDEFVSPLTLYLSFAINDETVFIGTFKAVLNGADITQQFLSNADDAYSKSITMSLGDSSTLQLGSNTLILSVEGIVPGTTDRYAVDTDRIVFTVLGN